MRNIFKLILIFIILAYGEANAKDSLNKAMLTSASGMKVQSKRIEVLAENIANADTTGLTPADVPYRRKRIFFSQDIDDKSGANIVKVEKISNDNSTFKLVYQPSHPAADIDGYVKYPNVDKVLETIDLKEAQRSYEANVSAIQITRGMAERTLELLR